MINILVDEKNNVLISYVLLAQRSQDLHGDELQ